MKPFKEDIENRLPVWEAFSELYRDVELERSDFEHIAAVCARSPYQAEELEVILFNEVWAGFGWNLIQTAGEWTGWPEETVKRAVLQRYKPRWRLPWRFHPLKRVLKEDWEIVIKEVTRLRAEAEDANEARP